MKSKGTAYLLWCAGLIGFCGLHRFYLGKIGTGILWLLTLGLLGIGQLIDLFILGGQVDIANMKFGAINGGPKQNQNVIVNVTNTNNNAESKKNEKDLAEEIRKYAKLQQEGHISREEFDAKKSELLKM